MASRRSLVLDIELADLLPGDGLQRGLENSCPCGVPSRCHQSVQYSWRLEALRSRVRGRRQCAGHRLHAARRARARQFAPQHRRQREAHQIVERAARQIGIDQRPIDLPRVLHRLEHRRLVMALNTTRCTGLSLSAPFFFKTSSTCQEMASPSRSGSVARISRSASFRASAMSARRLADLVSTSQDMAKSSSGRTEPSLAGKSRTWPIARPER